MMLHINLGGRRVNLSLRLGEAIGLSGALAVALVGAGCNGPVTDTGGNNLKAATVEESEIKGPVKLTDVTKRAGINFIHSHGGSGRRYMVETFAGGCAFFDYDRDGWQDIFLVQGAPLPDFKSAKPLRSALYRNNRNGTFTDVTAHSGLDVEMYGMAPSVGDYDNDNRPDLFVSAVGGNRLFHNEGQGKFRDVTNRARVSGKDWSTCAMWIDYDNDGLLDLFVGRYTDYSLATDIPCKSRSQPVYCSPGVYKTTHPLLYHNNGDGTFSDVTKKSQLDRYKCHALGVAPLDANEDGNMDITVASDRTSNLLLINNGDGTFTETAAKSGIVSSAITAYGGMGIDVGDPGNKGKPSVVVTNYAREPITIHAAAGGGLFTRDISSISFNATGARYVKWGCRFSDLDLDGFPDLFVANGHIDDTIPDDEDLGHHQPSQLFHNLDGQFTDISFDSGSFFQRLINGRGVAFGDYDNNGRTDLLIACNNEPAVLLSNSSAPRNHWVRIALQGSARPGKKGCNRDGLGARVQVKANDMTQTQYLRAGTSYLADHDRRLLFGIGPATKAQVEIKWPCGATQKLTAAAGVNAVVNENSCRLNK